MNNVFTNPFELGYRLSLFATICFLVGCSPSPSSEDGKRVILDSINKESAGRIKLIKFKKTNGAQGELMGFKIYALEFEAEVEFTEVCLWVTGISGQQLSFQTKIPPAQNSKNLIDQFNASKMMNPGTLVKSGERAQLSGVLSYVKKEKGWSVDSMLLTSVRMASVQALEVRREKAEKGDAKSQSN